MAVERIQVIDEAGATATVTSKAYPVLSPLLAVHVDVSTINSGTITLDVTVEYSADGQNWCAPASAQAVAQITTETTESAQFTPEGAMFRLVATVGGSSPDFDFTATAIFIA